MFRILGRTALLLALILVAYPAGVAAGPYDARVGETRAVYKTPSTSLRATPSALGAATAALRSGTRVVVLEVKQPWLRVRSQQGMGWLRSGETVEPSALNPNPKPVHTAAAAAAVGTQEVSAAGRQLDGATERGYRATRQDLHRAYLAVDAMEEATATLPPSESIGFIMGGALGRRGQDYVRPPLLPRTVPTAATQAQPRRGLGGVLGGLAGEAARRLGGNRRLADTVTQGVTSITGFVTQLKKNFTPEQEYYLGRAVAANAILKYGIDPSPSRRHYVRLVGDAVVRLSTRLSSTFGGYHFEVLDSDDVNAVSGPGGFVLLTRGVVEICRSEDELAAVLAHELAHIKLKHGENVLRSGRSHQSLMQGLVRTGAAAANVGDQRWARGLVEYFSGAVGEMSRVSQEHAYGRASELAADQESTYVLVDIVYDHTAMQAILRTLAARPGGNVYTATHTSAQHRAAQLDPVLRRYGPFKGSARVKQIRIDRLNQGLGRNP